jgi:catechol 2,3-dioxygenase-like lactoylglutathione lyase family enzyme
LRLASREAFLFPTQLLGEIHVLSCTGPRRAGPKDANTEPFNGKKLAGKKKERKAPMGILESAKPAIIICTRDRSRATAFYRNTLGLSLSHEDNFAAVFNTAGVTLRLSVVADFTPHEHTILGFHVPDLPATVKALHEKGVTFNLYSHFRQDDLGVWTAPGGSVQVAWFKDPDGNVLSLTNA